MTDDTESLANHWELNRICTLAGRGSAKAWRSLTLLAACLQARNFHRLLARHFPLAGVAAAHEAVESGHRLGNVSVRALQLIRNTSLPR
ncbi:MAG TPA: hypothetical protein V6D03_16595 [Candidatus Caenarcaniphilales bacterium]